MAKTLSQFSLVTFLYLSNAFLYQAKAETVIIELDPAAAGTVMDYRSDGFFDEVITGDNVISAQNVITDYPGTNYRSNGIMEFNISGINDPVTSAYLLLDIASANYTDPERIPISFFGYHGDGIAELSDATSGDPLILGLHQYTSASQTIQLDFTAIVNYMSRNDVEYLGVNMRIGTGYISGTPGDHFEINIHGTSPMNADPSVFSPQLVVTTVPVPPALFLFVSGLLIYTFMGRRASKS